MEFDLEKLNSVISELKGKIRFQQGYLDFSRNRYIYCVKMVYEYYNGGKILEIGSYPYQLTYILKALGFPVVGIDLDPKREGYFLKQNKIEVKKADVEKDRLPFRDNQFDIIIFTEIFEHLRNPAHALMELNRVLKDNGHLIITTPNLYYFPTFVRFLLGKGTMPDPFYQYSKIYWAGHMGHVREYSFSEMKNFLRSTNFVVKKRIYVKYEQSKKRSKKMILPGIITDMITSAVPFFRPFQVIIAIKGNKKSTYFLDKIVNSSGEKLKW